jgi:hypothetical protein
MFKRVEDFLQQENKTDTTVIMAISIVSRVLVAIAALKYIL